MQLNILVAATEEMRQKGFKFTMNDLAHRLGISKKTIYEYYSSKEEIIHMVMLEAIKDVLELEQQIITDPSLELIDKIKKILVLVPEGFDMQDLNLLEQYKALYPEQWEKIIGQDYLENSKALEILLRDGMKIGLIRDIKIAVILAMITEIWDLLVNPRFLLTHDLKLTEALEMLIDVIFNGILIEKK